MSEHFVEVHGKPIPVPVTSAGYIKKNGLMRLLFMNDAFMTYEQAKVAFAAYGVELDRGSYNGERRLIHGRQRHRRPGRKPVPQETAAPVTVAMTQNSLHQMMQATEVLTNAINTAKQLLASQPHGLQVVMQMLQKQWAS